MSATSQHLQPFDPDAAVFPVSVAASLADMHAQTLRGYDRLGLVVPQRARGRGRRYSLRDVAKLRHVQQLSQEGINLEGIRRILSLEAEVETLNAQTDRLANLVRRLQDEQGSTRVFTAGMTGSVYTGRSRPAPPRALTASVDG